MVLMDLYDRKKCEVIQTFPPVNNTEEAKAFLKKYCEEKGVRVIASEYCGDAHWNYLSDGTELDYCIEQNQ